MSKKMKLIWGGYAGLLAVLAAALIVFPLENNFVFRTAMIGTGLMFVLAGVFGALRLRREKQEGRLPAWPGEFTVLVVQMFFFIFLHMGALFCPKYIAVLAEMIVYAIMLVVVVGEENLREAVRWLYRRRKAAMLVALAVAIAIPALYFGIPFAKYKHAEGLLEKGEYERAVESFSAMDGYLDAETMYCESLYRLGVQLNETGEHEQAYFTMCDILDYADVGAYIESQSALTAVREKYSAYEVGNTVTFGTLDGQPLQWYVLDQQGSTRLLYAVEPVAYRAYNAEFDIMDWEICGLRAWLNGEFMQVFSAEETAMILDTEVVNNDNVEFRVEGGDDTVDKVYLLSIDEAEIYRKQYRSWFMGYTSWLRSPGCSRIDAALVTDGGGIYSEGANIHHDQYSVRPVLWIDIMED